MFYDQSNFLKIKTLGAYPIANKLSVCDNY
jgi:hypothetical protein